MIAWIARRQQLVLGGLWLIVFLVGSYFLLRTPPPDAENPCSLSLVERITPSESKTEAVAALGKLMAIAAAVLFAGYKLLAGFFLSSLKVNATCLPRSPSGDGQQNLPVSVSVTKGDRGSAVLTDVWVHDQLVDDAGTLVDKGIFAFDDTRRLDLGLIYLDEGKRWQPAPRRSELFLAPGDTMTFVHVLQVHKGSTHKLEVLVATKTAFWFRKGQWRASIVSSPDGGRPPITLDTGDRTIGMGHPAY